MSHPTPVSCATALRVIGACCTAGFLTMLSSAAVAATDCPAMDALVSTLGVRFSGFSQTIPEAKKSPASAWGSGPRISRVVSAPSAIVSDGYDHVVYVDVERGEAWIHRTRGLTGVNQWFGPVPVVGSDFASCAPKP